MESNFDRMLFSIQSELEEYELNDKFYENVEELINFYIKSVFKMAYNNVCKKIKSSRQIEYDFISQFDIDDFVKDLEEQYGLINKNMIIFTIIGKIIQFYKMSQVYTFYVSGYKKIYVDMNINTCEVCKKRFKDGIDLTEDIDETIFHPYCKVVFKGEKE